MTEIGDFPLLCGQIDSFLAPAFCALCTYFAGFCGVFADNFREIVILIRVSLYTQPLF